MMLRLVGLFTFLHLTRHSASFTWSKTSPAAVILGSPATLSWSFDLSLEEKKRADVFSLIIWEQEKYLYSDEWLVLAIKQPVVHFSYVVKKDKAVTVFEGKSASLTLGNVTTTDLTRFRCTFFSSFAAPKSIIQLGIPDEPIKVRLVDGPFPEQGRVELYRSGFWGTICSDGWDIQDATVVCRMLGYKGAWSVTGPAQYGQGSGPVWLEKLACTGDESSILRCPHGDWGKTSCDHSDDAGVVCYSPRTEKPPTQPQRSSSVQTQPELSTHTAKSTTRLQPTSSVQTQPASSARPQPTFSGSFSVDVVQPTPALVRSRTQGTSTVRSVSPTASSATSVSVSSRVAVTPQGSVRLVESSTPGLGLVEIYYNGTWGTICDDFWDLNDTKVVCRALGFQYAWTMFAYGAFLRDNNADADYYPTGPIWLDDVNCTGNENSLSECDHRGWSVHNCHHDEDAGIYCGHTPKPSEVDEMVAPSPVKPQEQVQVRLANGSSSWDGRVEVFYQGAWGTVCDDDWDMRDADVICRMLGSPGAVYPNCSWCPAGTDDQRVLLDEVWCGGQEKSIAVCSFTGWGIHNCGHDEDVGIVCRPPPVAPTTAPPPPKIHVRLRNPGGVHVNGGLVEVYYGGNWGTVCDDNWDNADGEVICRMLGYPDVLGVGTLGGGAGEILLDDVNCTGSEESIAECGHNGWRNHNCDHSQDAGVVCENDAVVQAKDAGCNFDTWFCRWDNAEDDTFDWSREFGATPSDATGPPGDHTSGQGYFLFLEASSWNQGDNATLVSPQISSSGPLCMTFYYHMYGATIGTLRVVFNQTVLWQLSGDQGNSWYKATVPILSTGVTQVNIVGDIGDIVYGDIAIDDIHFQETANCTLDAESVVPPAILSISSNQTIPVNSSVVLSCVVYGKPFPQVFWKRNGVILQNSTQNTNFTISRAQLSDKGAYECSAINYAGEHAKTTYITVIDKPRRTTVASNVSNDVPIAGETVTITCSARGYPVPNCRLSQDAVHLSMTAPLTYVIRNFSVQYVGTYRCNCSNELGNEEVTMELSFYVAPVIHTLYPRVQSFNETYPLTIYCNATGNPATNITWEKVGDDSRVFPPGELLHIQRTHRDDAGVYRCTARNGREFSATDTAVVNVQLFSPLIDQHPFNNMVVDSTTNVTFYCNATGKPTPTIKWTKAGDSKVLATGNTLVIENAGRLDLGSYICTATNGMGNPVSASAYLDVQYKPLSTKLEADNLNAVVFGNARIILTCSTDANPAPMHFHIYHNGVHRKSSTTGQYVIHKAVASDAGTFECAPENLLGFGDNATITVTVLGALSITSFPKNQTVTGGQSVTFYCNATSFGAHANFKPAISWTKVGDPSSSFPSAETLLFKNVSRYDAGSYQCQADNGVGRPDTAIAILHVLFKPSDTKLVSSAPNNNVLLNMSVIITCSANAKPAVSHYRIYHAGVLVSNSTSGTYNISRITPEYNGTFICIPVNSLGEGSSANLSLTFIASCGRRIEQPSSFAPQIVGGSDSQPGAWPWQVEIARTVGPGTFKHICGGAVLGRQWILTAAHCVRGEIQANLTITLGETQIGVDEGTEQVVAIKRIIVHPDYNQAVIAFDIALIELDAPILYNDYVGPVCMPSSNFSDNTMCYVSGWGSFGRNSPMTDKLQEASVPLYPHDKCVEEYKDLNPVTDHMLCAGFPNQNIGTCKGDSGGPLTCEDRGRWFLVGLTSWGRDGCADSGSPGVYSDILFFKGWIERTMS